jgi:hypothetical protein
MQTIKLCGAYLGLVLASGGVLVIKTIAGVLVFVLVNLLEPLQNKMGNYIDRER